MTRAVYSRITLKALLNRIKILLYLDSISGKHWVWLHYRELASLYIPPRRVADPVYPASSGLVPLCARSSWRSLPISCFIYTCSVRVIPKLCMHGIATYLVVKFLPPPLLLSFLMVPLLVFLWVLPLLVYHRLLAFHLWRLCLLFHFLAFVLWKVIKIKNFNYQECHMFFLYAETFVTSYHKSGQSWKFTSWVLSRVVIAYILICKQLSVWDKSSIQPRAAELSGPLKLILDVVSSWNFEWNSMCNFYFNALVNNFFFFLHRGILYLYFKM